MKAVILAGGFGTRLSELTNLLPKPMVTIGEIPILIHIMRHYSYHGVNEFIICLGYKSNYIKDYFTNYMNVISKEITYDFSNGSIERKKFETDNWRVTLVDTGLNTMVGGRIKRIKHLVCDDDSFCLTYGDGLSNVDISKLIEFHAQNDPLVTVTAVQPDGRFGALEINNNKVTNFSEKPKGDKSWINGGYFVVNPKAIDFIEDDQTIWEREPLENISKARKLLAFKHTGFWQPMDSLKDKNKLEELWSRADCPWRLSK